MINFIAFCISVSLLFFQCDPKANDSKSSNNTEKSNSNIEITKSNEESKLLNQEMLFGVWKGTEHNTSLTVFLSFKDGGELEMLKCSENKEIVQAKYKYYRNNNKDTLKISNETLLFYPWMNEYKELRFHWQEDNLGPGDPDNRPFLTFFVYKKIESKLLEIKMCGEKE
jgi:hypothetical protein